MLLDDYLRSKGLTRNRLADLSGINGATFKKLNDKNDLEGFNVKHLKAIGDIIKMRPSEVLRELEDMSPMYGHDFSQEVSEDMIKVERERQARFIIDNAPVDFLQDVAKKLIDRTQGNNEQ